MATSLSNDQDAPDLAAYLMYMWAVLKYWLWRLGLVLTIGPLYIALNSEGLRYLVPALGQKIFQLPGLHSLREYELWSRLDLAHFLSIVMLIAVVYLWDRIIPLWLGSDDVLEEFGWNPVSYSRLILALGVVIIGADAILFYVGMTQVAWGGASFSISALVATVAYLAVLVFVSFVSANLRKSIISLRKEN